MWSYSGLPSKMARTSKKRNHPTFFRIKPGKQQGSEALLSRCFWIMSDRDEMNYGVKRKIDYSANEPKAFISSLKGVANFETRLRVQRILFSLITNAKGVE